MAKVLHRSSNVASFDTHPSGHQSTDDPNRLLPEQAEPSPLENYGAHLGSAAGTAVVGLRRAKQKVREMTSQKAATVTDIAGARLRDATVRLEDVRDQASVRAEELGRSARERALELRRQVRNGVYRARLRAREMENQYPLQVVIGTGIAGLLLGAALRIWRSSRA
jgi:hypothetical protein